MCQILLGRLGTQESKQVQSHITTYEHHFVYNVRRTGEVMQTDARLEGSQG